MKTGIIKTALSILCASLGMMGWARPAQAQFDVGKTVAEFVTLCSSEDSAARAQCYGYVAGALDFQRLALQRLGIQGALFCPSAIVVAQRVVPDYLAWIQSKPGAMLGVPSMSLYLYFQEKNPCPTVTPAEAAEIGLPANSPHISPEGDGPETKAAPPPPSHDHHHDHGGHAH